MALRIDTAVIRGEIDNTTRGNVRGKLWLAGHEEPVVIDLRGNAWRDVAGCKVTFSNPKPEAQAVTTALQPKQSGYTGDITASRKVKVFTVPEEEWLAAYEERRIEDIPTEWRNSLYFEWFSEANGRVVIESADFELSISEWLWEMDEAEEEAQKMTNLHVMRGWLAGIIQRPESKSDDDDELSEEEFDDSEESWEESLKQSDRLTAAHLEALEKYGEDKPDDDRVSFVMGWDHMLGRETSESADEADEEDEGEGCEPAADAGFDEAELEQWLEKQEDQECHPLQKRAQDLVLRLMNETEEEGADIGDGNTPMDRLMHNTMNINGKLAGALGYGGMPGSNNTGYVLAILRRCLNWANEALAALHEMMESTEWQDRLRMLTECRVELFALRDGITDLRKELREK